MAGLPIILILEQHNDLDSIKHYPAIFKVLDSLGYNTLCLELPAEKAKNKEEIFKYLDLCCRPQYIILDKIIKKLEQNGEKVDPLELLKMKEENLKTLIRKNFEYEDQQINNEAYLVNKILTDQYKIMTFKNVSFDILAIDMYCNKNEDMNTPMNISKRDKFMSDRIIELYNNNKNIIHIVGALHGPGIAEHLKRADLLNDVLIIDLVSADEFKLIFAEDFKKIKESMYNKDNYIEHIFNEQNKDIMPLLLNIKERIKQYKDELSNNKNIFPDKKALLWSKIAFPIGFYPIIAAVGKYQQTYNSAKYKKNYTF